MISIKRKREIPYGFFDFLREDLVNRSMNLPPPIYIYIYTHTHTHTHTHTQTHTHTHTHTHIYIYIYICITLTDTIAAFEVHHHVLT